MADGSESTTATWVNGSDGKRICTIKPSFHDWDNARLIAAAPELLEALRRILYAHDTKNIGASMGEAKLCDAYADQARAAIAKATGE